MEEEAVSKASKLQLHKDNPPDTPPDRHGDPLLTPEVSGSEETQNEDREETPVWPQQPHNDTLCCEKNNSPGHQDNILLPQCEGKTATGSSGGEVPLEVLESRRDLSLELQLKKLFESTKSLTAKENMLLSLRYCPHLPSPLPLTLTSHHPSSSPPLPSPSPSPLSHHPSPSPSPPIIPPPHPLSIIPPLHPHLPLSLLLTPFPSSLPSSLPIIPPLTPSHLPPLHPHLPSSLPLPLTSHHLCLTPTFHHPSPSPPHTSSGGKWRVGHGNKIHQLFTPP